MSQDEAISAGSLDGRALRATSILVYAIKVWCRLGHVMPPCVAWPRLLRLTFRLSPLAVRCQVESWPSPWMPLPKCSNNFLLGNSSSGLSVHLHSIAISQSTLLVSCGCITML